MCWEGFGCHLKIDIFLGTIQACGAFTLFCFSFQYILLSLPVSVRVTSFSNNKVWLCIKMDWHSKSIAVVWLLIIILFFSQFTIEFPLFGCLNTSSQGEFMCTYTQRQ